MPIPAMEGVEPNQEDHTFSRLQLLAQQRRAMEEFWRRTQEQIEESSGSQELVLPVAHVKNVIHVEEDGMMLSADTLAFVTKLCELFVQELILRAWVCANSHNREIILGIDIAEAITTTESYHFLGNVLRSHQALGSTTPDIEVSARKCHNLDKMSSVCHSPQEVQVSHLARYTPHVPTCPPIGQMSTCCTPSAYEFMMQGESLLKANKKKSPQNEVMVPTDKVTMNDFDVVASGGGSSSTDVAIHTNQGEIAQPFSFQYSCPPLEDNYFVSNAVGHGDSFCAPADANIKQIHQEQTVDSQDAIVGEEILSNESLEGDHTDEDLPFPEKDLPQ